MESEEKKFFELFLSNGSDKKAFYLDQYKVTIGISVILVFVFIGGIIWLASNTAGAGLTNKNKNAADSGILYDSGGVSDRFKAAVEGANTQSQIGPQKSLQMKAPVSVKPSPSSPTIQPTPTEDDSSSDEPEPTSTPTPAPTESPASTPTPTQSPTPSLTPTPSQDPTATPVPSTTLTPEVT